MSQILVQLSYMRQCRRQMSSVVDLLALLFIVRDHAHGQVHQSSLDWVALADLFEVLLVVLVEGHAWRIGVAIVLSLSQVVVVASLNFITAVSVANVEISDTIALLAVHQVAKAILEARTSVSWSGTV